ncbi:hypothetical protein QYE76_014898 [Lolium multiflorum]|uniref:Pentatricopeptide repeat-containing protein n=1 Tax=Lolium multiflorum TaxID=4521 RepID=A0AAD8U3D1_LOLMU|nr:hypothetical protein QYE76_014898 [Lolium multiflorum]
MARCSIAKPLGGTTTAAPHHPHRCGQLPTSAAASPIITTRTRRLSALSKPPPPSLPLFPRPKLPIPTTSSDAPTNGKQDNSKELNTVSSRPSSGAGDVLRLMDVLCVAADEDVYISLLKNSVDTSEVATVHAHIKGAAFPLPLPLANRLLLTYASCGDTVAARKVFDEMPVKNAFTWATMVSAYSDGSLHNEAIRLFSCMMCHEDLAADVRDCSIVAVLRSCARLGELSFGEQVHAIAIKARRVHGDTGSSLLQLYCESNRHDSARQVLETMRCSSSQLEPVPEAAWTSFMTACHRDGLLDEAFDVFRDMVSSGDARSSFSLSTILAVCAESEKHGWFGQQVHADAVKHGVETNQFVVSGLVHMYANQGRLADAARAFEGVGGKPDVVCWNAMAMGYARGGWYREAARMVYQMKAAGIDPPGVNVVRMACAR